MPAQYPDASRECSRKLLGLAPDQVLSHQQIEAIKMGTTVATNALLERKGERTVLFTTRGFRDALRIGYQERPRLFDLRIVVSELLYERIEEVDERVDAQGRVMRGVDRNSVLKQLQAAHAQGLRSIAIVFMHAYRYPDHENEVAALAREVGFTQVSVSHE